MLVGIILGFFMIAYEDDIIIKLFKTLKCKIGYHNTLLKFGKAKINKYYCVVCRKPRSHPGLKVIEGGNKVGTNRFDF